MTLDELRMICVERFPNSKTRIDIMNGLEEVLKHLRNSNVDVEMWVDGSFLTKKCDPNDSDIVLLVPIEILVNGSQEQKTAIAWVGSNQKQNHKCDSYVFTIYPADNILAKKTDWMKAYWTRQFGFSRNNQMKGIAVLQTGGAE